MTTEPKYIIPPISRCDDGFAPFGLYDSEGKGLWNGDRSWEQKEATRDRIVASYNLHDDLLKSLKDARELTAKAMMFAGELTRQVIEKGLEEIDSVIAKAEGKENV